MLKRFYGELKFAVPHPYILEVSSLTLAIPLQVTSEGIRALPTSICTPFYTNVRDADSKILKLFIIFLTIQRL